MSHTKKNVLVIGASGFVGRHLCKKLSKNPDVKLASIVRKKPRATCEKSDMTINVVDLASRKSLEKVVEGIDIVINLAYDFKSSAEKNIRNFENLTQACIRKKVKHFVHVSSVAVYDDWPHENLTEKSPSTSFGSDYKRAKVFMEKALERFSAAGSLPATIIQPTIVYGPYSWLWTDYIVEKLMTGVVVLPEGLLGLCNVVYVDDVVDALILAALNAQKNGEKYIVSGPEPITWAEFYETYDQYLGTNSIQYHQFSDTAEQFSEGGLKQVLSNPLAIAKWKPVATVLNTIERMFGPTVIAAIKSVVKSIKRSQGEIIYYPSPWDLKMYESNGECSIEKAQSELGYSPKVSFSAGFHKTTLYIDNVLRARFKSASK